MKHHHFCFIIIFVFILSSSVKAQGHWTTFYPNTRFNGVIAVDEDVTWCGTERGVLRFNKNDETFTRYTEEDGLASNTVLSIAIDNEGVKWFGTPDGLSRFDGHSWRTYTTADGLASNTINAIAGDDNGVLWFGTNNGLTRFDGEHWKTFTTDDGLAFNKINLLSIDNNGVVWAVMYTAISCFDGVTWSTPYIITPGDDTGIISSIAIDKDNVKWFCWRGLFGGPVMSYDDVEWTTYDSHDPYFVTVGPNNVKYFIAYYYLIQFDGDVWTQKSFEDKFPYTVMLSLVFDENEVKWIISGKNLIKYDEEIWKTYGYYDGPEGKRINTILIESSGVKWFGAWNRREKGISRYDGQKWTYFTLVGGERVRPFPNIVLASAIDSYGVKWFGTYEGLWKYEDRM